MTSDLPMHQFGDPDETARRQQQQYPRRYRSASGDKHQDAPGAFEDGAPEQRDADTDIDRYGYPSQQGAFERPVAGVSRVEGYQADGRPHRAEIRWKRARWVLAAVRSSPLLAVGSAFAAILIGLTITLGITPSWRIGAEFLIASPSRSNEGTANLGSSGAGASVGDAAATAQPLMVVEPADVRTLINSPSIRRDVTVRLTDEIAAWQANRQKQRDALTKAVEDGRASIVDRLRPSAQWIVATISTVPAKVSTWFGARGAAASDASLAAGPESAVVLPAAQADGATMIFQFQALSGSGQGGQVVKVAVRAASPTIAQACPIALLESLKNELTNTEHARARAELETIQPKLEAAGAELAGANDAVTQYQLECGAQDPSQKAAQLQAKLVDLRKDEADLRTQIEEGQATRFEIDRQLKQTNPEQISQEVITSNPHIAELEKQISDLNSQYNAELAIKQPAHPDMKKLKLEIQSKTKDLNDEKRQIISQMVKQPSPAYLALQDQQIRNDLKLTSLAGRDSGLAEAEEQLVKELADANKTTQHMNELTSLRDRVRGEWVALDGRSRYLTSILHDSRLFSNISLIGAPHVADERIPDEPDVPLYLSLTAAAAFSLFFVLPSVKAMWRDRIVGLWQIEAVSQRVPVHLAGEIPALSARRLLGGRSASAAGGRAGVL